MFEILLPFKTTTMTATNKRNSPALPAIIFFAIALAACSNGPSDAEKAAEAKQKVNSAMEASKHTGIDITGLAIEPKDPYCMMPVTAGVSDTATINGKLYGFCAATCKEEYLKELAAQK